LRRVLDRERIRVIRTALSELPCRVQECLRASVVEGLKYGEIGERLGISENTVAVHVHRGLKSLRRRVKLFFKEEPFVGGL
jgi:RNA polymerase sigma-70 factor (ECF subfamily)